MNKSNELHSEMARLVQWLSLLSKRMVVTMDRRWILGGLSACCIGSGMLLWESEQIDGSNLTYAPLPEQVYQTTMDWALPGAVRSLKSFNEAGYGFTQKSKTEHSDRSVVKTETGTYENSLTGDFLSYWEKLPSIAWLAEKIPTKQLDYVAKNQRSLDSTKSRTRVGSHLSERYKVEPDFMGTLVTASYLTAKEVGLDPLLILAVAAIESNFIPTVESNAGAKGLMQIMVSVHRDKLKPFGGDQAALNPYANMKIGALILKDCLVRAGSLDAGLRMYVGATSSATEAGYGRKVLSEYFQLRKLTGLPNPPILSESKFVEDALVAANQTPVQMTAAVEVVYPPPIKTTAESVVIN